MQFACKARAIQNEGRVWKQFWYNGIGMAMVSNQQSLEMTNSQEINI